MSVTTSYPEAAFGLRALFRGLPGVVRRVMFTCNLLRTGCIRCGVGPHSVYDCPFVDALEANQMSLRLYKQWSTIIGEELMIFGVASSSANYMDAAISRISARSDLPRRRPRRVKITQIGSGSGVNGSAGITSPLLPLPGVLAAQDASKAAAPPENPTGSSRAVSGAKASPKAVINQA